MILYSVKVVSNSSVLFDVVMTAISNSTHSALMILYCINSLGKLLKAKWTKPLGAQLWKNKNLSMIKNCDKEIYRSIVLGDMLTRLYSLPFC